MNTTLAIQITEQDIDEGKRADCRYCAGALALNRAMASRGLSVEGGFCCYGDPFFIGPEQAITIGRLSHALARWQDSFDAYKRSQGPRPSPAEFILFLE